MADAVRGAVEDWTGDRPPMCPWRPFALPRNRYVDRVLRAFRWYETGQLELYEPEPSYRLLEGISHLASVRALVEAQLLEEERRNAKARGEQS